MNCCDCIFLILRVICNSSIFRESIVASTTSLRGRRAFLPLRASRAGLFSNLSAWDTYPLRILDFVEVRLPPLISHEKTAPSRQSHQKNPSAPFY